MGSGTNPMNNNHNGSSKEKSAPKASAADRETSEIHASIAQTRADMSGTLDELHGRLNPAVLKEQALDSFHEAKASIKAEMTSEFHEAKSSLKAQLNEVTSSLKAEVKAEMEDAKAIFKQELFDTKAAVREATIGKVENMVHSAQETVTETGNSLVDTIKANPVPAALAGVGLAWLFMNMRASSRQKSDRTFRSNQRPIGVDGQDESAPLGRVMHQLGEKAGQAAHAVQRTAGSVAHQASDLAQKAQTSVGAMAHGAQESVSHFAHDTQASVGQYAHDAQLSASQLAQQAQRQARQLETRFETTLHDNPLAIGAVVLALGTAVGLAIPTTRREDQWMGAVRDEVFGKAEELAHGALGQVEEAVKHLGEDMTKSLKGNGAKLPAGVHS